VGSGFLASRLNHLGATHWKKFATQDYFDKGGFFISVMLSLPAAVIAICIVVLLGPSREGSHSQVNMLLHASRMLIAVKREEFRRAKAKTQKAD
jgi:hypothetical protein